MPSCAGTAGGSTAHLGVIARHDVTYRSDFDGLIERIERAVDEPASQR